MSTELQSSKLIYGRMPDGTVPDFGRIFEVIDEILGTDKNNYKEAVRYMYQFKDAVRNYRFVKERYDYITAPMDCGEKRFMRDPSARVETAMKNAEELPGLLKIRNITGEDLEEALKNVISMIGQLKNDSQKLVMTAHYVCLADSNIISRVYEHQDRWAREIHDKAIREIAGILEDGVTCECTEAMEQETEHFANEWKEAERAWIEKEKQRVLLIREEKARKRRAKKQETEVSGSSEDAAEAVQPQPDDLKYLLSIPQ